MPTPNLFSRVISLTGLPYGNKLDSLLKEFHQDTPNALKSGRNVIAGYARSWGLQFCDIAKSIEEDPLFQESLALTRDKTLLTRMRFTNIFMIMKYGIKNLSGDFVEFGCYKGGSAFFIANVAKGLGMTGKIYALDTFEGMPPSDNSIDIHFAGNFADASYQKIVDTAKELDLPNLIFVKGLFQETLPEILRSTKNIVLAHIDCDIYESVKYSINSLPLCMHQPGGYVIFDDPTSSSCLGSMEAVEEMIENWSMRAEQTWPHLVYRFPKLGQSDEL